MWISAFEFLVVCVFIDALFVQTLKPKSFDHDASDTAGGEAVDNLGGSVASSITPFDLPPPSSFLYYH